MRFLLNFMDSPMSSSSRLSAMCRFLNHHRATVSPVYRANEKDPISSYYRITSRVFRIQLSGHSMVAVLMWRQGVWPDASCETTGHLTTIVIFNRHMEVKLFIDTSHVHAMYVESFNTFEWMSQCAFLELVYSTTSEYWNASVHIHFHSFWPIHLPWPHLSLDFFHSLYSVSLLWVLAENLVCVIRTLNGIFFVCMRQRAAGRNVGIWWPGNENGLVFASLSVLCLQPFDWRCTADGAEERAGNSWS